MADRLNTVESYVREVRTLLLDKVAPFRYQDDEVLRAFNTALLEGRRLRPDLFVYRHGNRVPQFEAVDGEEVHIEQQFRLAFVYGTAAQTIARDEDDVQDERSASFWGVFEAILVGTVKPPIKGGTPGGPSQPPRPGQ